MKSVVRRIQKKLYGFQGLGYALECLVDVASLPRKFRAQEQLFRAQEQRFTEVEQALAVSANLRTELGEVRNRVESVANSGRSELAGITRHLPTILNYLTAFENASRELAATIEGVRAAGETRTAAAEQAINHVRVDVAGLSELLHRRLGELRERIEFVRVETLFEVNYGRSARSPDSEAESVTPRIVNADKVEAMGKELRLNLGSGHIPVEGYINIDRRELPGVDVVAEVNKVPFPPATVKEVFSSHLIEHFAQEQLRREVLPHWHQLLAPGGTLRAILPDWVSMIREYANGNYPFEHLREVTFGGQDYQGDFHFNMFSVDSLASLLKEAGFQDVQFPVVGRVNGKCLEMEVVARK